MSSSATALSFLFLALSARVTASIAVPSTSSVKPTALEAFVSLSIEFGDFPLFAGTLSAPNEFSVNLLKNLGSFQEYMPRIRVGGNTQDDAVYDANLKTATASSCSVDTSATLCIGPSFFNSYGTFPNTLYGHGFNLAYDNNVGYETLKETVPLACKAIGSKVNVYELGNEPDQFGSRRPSPWTVSDYVAEWLNGTSHIATYMAEACPDLAAPQFMAPSFATPDGSLSPVTTFQDGLDSKNAVGLTSMHNYIGSGTSAASTLSSTLLDHDVTVSSLTRQVNAAKALASIDPAPYILGETNSLFGGGREGVSDVFGAALWVLDFTLYAASTGVIHRLHFHQRNGAWYNAWNPVASSSGATGTHPPYYGKLAAARFLGASDTTAVVEILSGTYESAYAAYSGGKLVRLAVLNLNEYSSTSTAERPVATYSFTLSGSLNPSQWKVEKLTAAGSDVKTGVTFGGYSYDYSSLGVGVEVDAVETIQTVDGVLSVEVSNSQAVVLTLV